jgi:hypothetical protein
MTGALLALLTWATAIAAITLVGLALASLSSPIAQIETVRRSLWWGLGAAIAVILAASLVTPLRGVLAAWAMALTIAVASAVAYLRWRSTRGRSTARTFMSRPTSIGWALLAVMGAATIYLAFAALGPVTNYDSGLYHLGAIKYAGDFVTIPGLANLYFPFGYNASLFPAAAFLGNGPWDGQGFRLANGLVLVLVMTDLALRMVGGRRTIGTRVLMVGVPVILIPMVALSDYWVTSPTTDSSVFALIILAVAYLCDALWSRHNLLRDGLVAFVVAVLLVSLRPLMAVFLLAAVSVLIATWWHYKKNSTITAPVPKAALFAAGLLAVALGALQSARDYLLSGWLQYPLSVVAFDVPWRAPDPVWNRTPTLGAARDPLDLWAAAEGYQWIPAWINRLSSQWETYYLLALALAAVIAWTLVRRSKETRTRLMLVSLIPVFVTLVAWFLFSPPSFRFAWGLVFAVPVVAIAWAMQAADSGVQSPNRHVMKLTPLVMTGAITAVVFVVGYSAVARLDLGSMTQQVTWTAGPIEIPIEVTPITEAPVSERKLPSGLIVLVPAKTDQCWDAYPLCTAQLDETVGQRGSSLRDGFSP